MKALDAIRIMIVDDSVLVRGLLRKIVEQDGSFNIVSTVGDGEAALHDYKTYRPDIVLLDIEMPIMDGLMALKKIIEFDSEAKIIICSSLTQSGAKVSMEALHHGAVDYLSKPSSKTIDRGLTFEQELLLKLKTLNKKTYVKAKSIETLPANFSQPSFAKGEDKKQEKDASLLTIPNLPKQFPLVLAVGASTGGPKTLVDFFKNLNPKIMVPIFVTQHIPPGFSQFLADNISKNTEFKAKEAQEGDIIQPGYIYIAPGQKHLCVEKSVPKK